MSSVDITIRYSTEHTCDSSNTNVVHQGCKGLRGVGAKCEPCAATIYHLLWRPHLISNHS
jgi:hypothetical protein